MAKKKESDKQSLWVSTVLGVRAKQPVNFLLEVSFMKTKQNVVILDSNLKGKFHIHVTFLTEPNKLVSKKS